MAYKTILAHCNDKKRLNRIAGAAVELAERFQAHLVGLSVAPPVLVVPAGVPGSPDTMVIDERAQVYRRDNPAMKTAFQAAVDGKTLTSVTMGMPALIYRWYFGAHGLKSLGRSILAFVGIKPIRETLIGMVDSLNDRRSKAWLEKLRALGARGQ